MGKINNTNRYTFDVPSEKDFLVGTDGDGTNRKTRSYRIQDVIDLFPNQGVNQNNLGLLIGVGVIPDGSNIANVINSRPQFEVTERDITIFTCSKYVTIGEGFAGRPGTPVGMDIISYKYLLKLGKGWYGTSIDRPTITLDMFDLIEIFQSSITIPSTSDQLPVPYLIQNPDGLSALQAINTLGIYLVEAGKDVYFTITNVDGEGKEIVYRFVGATGVYGIGNTQVIATDLLTLGEMGIGSSNNIKVVKVNSNKAIGPSQTKASIVMALPTFTITENDLYVFGFREPVIVNGNQEILASSWLFKKGKGIYGVGSPLGILTDDDFELNFKEVLASFPIGNPVEYTNLDFYGNAGVDVITAINTSTDPIMILPATDNLLEKNRTVYKFIGAIGIYGLGNMQAVLGDLEELSPEVISIDTILDGDSTFTGDNIFEKVPQIEDNAVNPNDAVRFSQLEALLTDKADDNEVVLLQGAQTINDIKTFQNAPISQEDAVNADQLVRFGQIAKQKVFEVDLGTWDMDKDLTKNVVHSLDSNQWKTARVLAITVKNDDNDEYFNATNVISASFDNMYFKLLRELGDVFDNLNFDDTAGSYNRGWITFTYDLDAAPLP